MPTLGPFGPAAFGATFVVSPKLMAAMAREPLCVPDLPPSNIEIGAFLIVRAVDSEESHFHVADTVMHVPQLWEHLRLSTVEHRELCLRMNKSCCPIYPAVYTNEYV